MKTKLSKNDVYYLAFAVALTITWIILFPFRWAPIIIAGISSIPRMLLQLHDLKEDDNSESSIPMSSVKPQNDYGYLTIIVWGIIEFGLEIIGMWFMNYYFTGYTTGVELTLLYDGLGYILGVVVFIITNVICLRKKGFDRAFFLIESMWLLYVMSSVFVIYGAILVHQVISQIPLHWNEQQRVQLILDPSLNKKKLYV